MFIDGKPTGQKHNLRLNSKVKYVGNSSSRQEPFGIVADLKIYAYPMKLKELIQRSILNPRMEFEMPDRHMMKFMPLLPYLIGCIPRNDRQTNASLFKVLCVMTTNKDIRQMVLRSTDLIGVLLRYQNHPDLALTTWL